jgi:hypothetical protein
MSGYVQDLNVAKPSDNDAVSDGAKEIRDVKSALKKTFPRANSALDVSNDSINTAIQTDIPALQDRVAELVPGDDIGTTRGLFASVTHAGGSGEVNPASANNVSSITWPQQAQNTNFRFARVQFESPIPGSDGQFPGDPNNGVLDVNVNIQVTPFSNANNSLNSAGFVNSTITNIDKDGCEIAFTQLDSNGQQQNVWYQAFCLIVALN